VRNLKQFIVHQVKDQMPQKVREKAELIVEAAQDVLSKAKLLAWAAKEREKMKKISYDEEPTKWTGLHNAGLGNLTTAVFQLKRISFSDEEIIGSLKIILEKVVGDTE